MTLTRPPTARSKLSGTNTAVCGRSDGTAVRISQVEINPCDLADKLGGTYEKQIL